MSLHRVLDSVVVAAESGELEDLGWPPLGTETERVEVRLERHWHAPEAREKLRIVCGEEVLEVELDLSGLAPHQLASVRLQCALAASRAARDGILVHAAGLGLAERGAVVALAPSGGGKSTLSTLCSRFAGFSDECVLLTTRPTARLHATPLRSSSSKEPVPFAGPLRAILVLEKSLEPRFERMDAPSSLQKLLAQVYKFPVALRTPAAVLAIARCLVTEVPCYRFAFPKSPAAQDLLFQLFDDLDRAHS